MQVIYSKVLACICLLEIFKDICLTHRHSLLSPIGQYRFQHVSPSKGKRSKKRKRRDTKAEDELEASTPAPPELAAFIIVGLNSVIRRLEDLSQKSKPTNVSTEGKDKEGEAERQPSDEVDGSKELPQTQHFSVIWASHSPEKLKEHLPQLVATACLARPNLLATRVIQIPKAFDARLCQALGLPRVSCIGLLEDAPHSKPLVDLVRESVPAVEVPWLQEIQKSVYLPVKINAIETFTSIVVKKQ